MYVTCCALVCSCLASVFSAQQFELTIDEIPDDSASYEWSPYIASLAVLASKRMLGIGRRLMQEAERTAREWRYREVQLEVASCNVEAIQFYKRLGYKIIGSDIRGTGATTVEVCSFYWRVLPVEK